MSDLLSTLALCWLVERRDGVTLALTDHDRDLTVGGVTYRAAPGMTPSAVVRAEGLDADTMDARGALHAAAISEVDLDAGRWDGARVAMSAVDWSMFGAAPIALGEGTIGAVEMTEGRFTAELAGPGAGLERPAVEETTPTCRATLGDRRCRVPLAGRRRHARVTAAVGAVLTLDRAEPGPDAYGWGMLRWLDGENGGCRQAIAASAGTKLTLVAAPIRPVAAGTLVELVEGCDRTLATCTARFGNAANFRGEPHLPGMDLVTRWIGG